MILPKGSLEMTEKGGPGTVEEMIGHIKKEKLTGYILVLGTLEDPENRPMEVTGQLVFKEGSPVLCEAVHNKTSIKGKKGVHTLLKAMTRAQNKVELHTKIDVGPPLAFFKECKVLEADVDLKAFKEAFHREEVEKRKREEEQRRKEDYKNKVRSEVGSWISSGHTFSSFPAIMEKDFETIEAWFKEVSPAMEMCISLSRWADSITEPDLEEQKGALLKALRTPEDMDAIKRTKEELQSRSNEIAEKRREMKKWVDVWKEEGYNTKGIEQALKGDIGTAWDNLTQFMDDIQKLKEFKDEVEAIAKEDAKKVFASEITDIEFLLNDPLEIGPISERLSALKETMSNEKKAKETLLKEASQLKEKGFEMKGLKELMSIRLDKFKVEFNLFVNNAYKIELMRNELAAMDRKDLPSEIDTMRSKMIDPFILERYETELQSLKKRLEKLASERKNIMNEVETFKEKGYLVDEVEEAKDLTLEKFKAAFMTFRSKVTELEGLSIQVSDMDHRWLEEEFNEMIPWFHDVSKVAQIRQRMKELRENIDRREKERSRVRSDMLAWEKEGFNVERLKGAIEESLPTFTSVHKDLSERIMKAKVLLKKLEGLDSRFFVQEAAELKAKIMDPYLTDNATASIDSLRNDIQKDKRARDALSARLKELARDSWRTDGLERILKYPPYELEGSIAEVERKVKRLKEALDEMEKWDQLECNWLSNAIEDLKASLRRIEGGEKSLDLYEELKERVVQNKQQRDTIRKQLEKWKDEGYITKNAHEKVESDISELGKAYDDLKARIEKLENVQKVFDRLDFKHFRSLAEEIEYRLNDPYLVEQLEKDVNALKEKIDVDRKKRQGYGERIKAYVAQGFIGAKRLIKVMEEDTSIIELEFRNFDKEVESFKKLLSSTGYIFVQEKKQDGAKATLQDKEQKELTEALDNLMMELSDKQ